MQLSSFLQDLFTEGKVLIAGQLTAFDNNDLVLCNDLLKEAYQQDILHMPATAPAYNADAALWAARYLYTALQLTVIRNLEAEKVAEQIEDFTGSLTPATIYSADLVLRYLPDVFLLAKGLSPADIMVKKLAAAALQWPFSSVGIPLTDRPDETIILQHSSLQIAYIDRIIQRKDVKRMNNEAVQTYVQEALGNYAENLWPETQLLFPDQTEATEIK